MVAAKIDDGTITKVQSKSDDGTITKIPSKADEPTDTKLPLGYAKVMPGTRTK